jgi:hypothetical protein
MVSGVNNLTYLKPFGYLLLNEKKMKINVNHPTFITYLDEITTNVLSIVSINNYFLLNGDAKLGIQYVAFKFIDSSLKVRITMEEDDIKKFIEVLIKKTNETENYEFSGVLKDMLENFDKMTLSTRPKTTKTTRRTKKDVTD